MTRFILFTMFCMLLGVPVLLPAQNDINNDVDKLQRFLQALDTRYVDSVATDDLVEKAMRRMLEELDPHSVYLTAEGYRRANEPLKGAFVGIGIRYRMVADTLTIVEVFEDSPAERAFMEIGDQFLTISGDTVAGVEMSEGDITQKIKGDEKTSFPVTIRRPNKQKELAINLERDQVRMKSIEITHMLTDNIGFIKLDRFSATSYSEFKRALSELNDQGMENLVLDLRGNSGGYLNIAIKIADEFLSERKVLVYTEGIHQAKKELFATSGGRFLTGKLIVLMDENSASASEILAGAIQDWDRGLIIGRRSYGKGLVQRTVEFNDGSAMRLTVSRYYTPTGRSIQKPYDLGKDAYRKDLGDRHSTGELYSKDSIYINKDYTYYTPGKRAVYGGGGIIPDVFIGADTSGRSDYFSNVAGEGLLEGFAIRYVESNENDLLAAYPTPQNFARSFQTDEVLMKAFVEYCTSHNQPFIEDEYKVSERLIKKYIMSYIARFTFDMDGFYLAYANFDPYIQSAIEEFDNNTFEELGLK